MTPGEAFVVECWYWNPMRWSLESLQEHLLIGSTLVEGSTLSEADAAAVLAGRTISGHPIHEVRELLNYQLAVRWLVQELEKVPFLSVDLILNFHQRLFAGFDTPKGVFKAHRNFTFRSDGSKLAYFPPHEVPEAVRQWVEDFNSVPSVTPAKDAALLYARFQQIHPFDDGNGRMGRVLIAYWLHWKFRKTFVFYASDKTEHLEAIEATDGDHHEPLIHFFETRLRDEGA
jgi:Fic family protein